MVTPDLIEALRRIEVRAERALESLKTSDAIRGTNALVQIKHEAADAIRHAEQSA